MHNVRIENLLAERCGRISAVHCEPCDLDMEFMEMASRFSQLDGSVALVSGGDLDCARFDLLGIWPWLTLSGRERRVRLTINDQPVELADDPFEVLSAVVDYFKLPEGSGPPMTAGLLGYLSYDLKDMLENLHRTSVDELGLPLMVLYAPSLLVVHDQQAGTTRLMVPQRIGGPEPVELIARFRQTLRQPAAVSTGFAVDNESLASNFSRSEYRTAIRRILEYIAAGDIYQANMTQRFEAPFSGDAFALFRHLFALNPAPFYAFVQCGDHQIVSTSPERFMMQNGDQVETRPIKGTRPRCRAADQDAAMRHELENSAKDAAELAMIVDLLRNDIGKVCRPGSVRVREHKRLEAYTNVYHLVSVVEGVLDEGQTSVSLLRAAFPGGSITGCPKVRAMEIIDELESCRRHVYCGSIGYIGFDRCMDFSIAIRTATILNDTLRFAVGGGIVIESDPDQEYEETLHKGRTLLAACRGGGQITRPRNIVWFNGRLTPADAARVKVHDQGVLYGFGLFETIRADGGRAPLLEDHLKRFNCAWQSLMPDPPPDLSWGEIIRQVVHANGLEYGCAAVKLLVTRGSRRTAPWDHALLVSTRPYTHRLAGKSVPGLRLGCYPHPRQTPLANFKTLNYLYYLKAGEWATQNGLDEAVILNPNGTVSETNSANLLLIDQKTITRPHSPTVLPGVMAQALCRQLAEWGYTIEERPVLPDDLLSAGQVLAANGLMGAAPVLHFDGNDRPEGGDLWRRLNDAIIPGWRAGSRWSA